MSEGCKEDLPVVIMSWMLGRVIQASRNWEKEKAYWTNSTTTSFVFLSTFKWKVWSL
jgi:hypothetical protein